jgi:hypothetical protein
MSRLNRRGSVAIVALFLASVGAPSATAAGAAAAASSALPRGTSDITATAIGQKVASETAARWAAKGLAARPLRVVKDDNGMLVVSADTKFASYAVRLSEGRTGIALAPLTPDAPALAKVAQTANLVPDAAGIVPLISPSWTFQGNDCFNRISDTWSWMDHCYYMYRLSSDGNGSYDWFALNHYATAANNSPWALSWARIRAYRSGSSAQTWADWSPRSNWSGGSCSTTTIGVTLPVGGIGTSFDRCPEQISFDKSAGGTSPDYTQTWIGPGTHGNRELNFEISVRVVQGGWAQWALPAEVHVGPV